MREEGEGSHLAQRKSHLLMRVIGFLKFLQTDGRRHRCFIYQGELLKKENLIKRGDLDILIVQILELASDLESDLRDTVDWGRKVLVNFNAGGTQLVSFDRSIALVLLI